MGGDGGAMNAHGSDDPGEADPRGWSKRLNEPPNHIPVLAPPLRTASVRSDGGHTGSSTSPRERRKTGYVISSIALVIIAAAAAIGLSTAGHQGSQAVGGGQSLPLGGGSETPGAGIAPAVFVVSSATSTLHQHSAELTISGSVSGNGQTVPINGTGYVDFDHDAFSAEMTMNSPEAGPLGEDEVSIGGHIYLSVGADGVSISQLTGGPHWIDVPVPEQDSSQLGTGNVDPLVQMQFLEQQGATISPLGTSTMEGQTVSGYSVTPSQAEEQQAIQQEERSGEIPPSAVPMVNQELQAIGTPTMDVYFDSSKLLRKLSVTFGGVSSPVSASVQMTFDNYGTSVDIGPPVSSDVISYSQFLQVLQASESST
jgi:hypothetical protein